MPKRKVTYEQDLALQTGRRKARHNQRMRAADRQERERVEAERAAAERDHHEHGWKNWEYVLDYTHEVRECRDCGFAEMRRVQF